VRFILVRSSWPDFNIAFIMSKTKKNQRPREAYPKLPIGRPDVPNAPPTTHAMRETVESIVIAFVLAFLFRTFEAEAFVIPTGSMAPTLMGRHKDVECPKCGYRYQVSASEEESDDPRAIRVDNVAAMCPICHYVLPTRPDLPGNVEESREGDIEFQRSHNGDRILVNKYIYTYSEPQRWDVVVFKFPGNAQINYIKRLVGLPGETLRIYQGDVFVRDQNASQQTDFKILHKPPSKVLAMRQLVHDTDHDPAELFAGGWPLRWQPAPMPDAGAWQVAAEVEGTNVRQKYSFDSAEDADAWLRYMHIVPSYAVWRRLADFQTNAPPGTPGPFAADDSRARPRLITDANPYNARQGRYGAQEQGSLEIDAQKLGLHWVGDLMLEADVAIEEARGELMLDLVEGGQHFRCTIDLQSGKATFSAVGIADYQPTANTSIRGPGEYSVRFANVDDQLLLWIDGDLVDFEGGTAYDAEKIFGNRRNIVPKTSDEDLGDLAPAGVGARNAKLSVSGLRLWRDIYYIADSWERNRGGELVMDFDHSSHSQLLALPYEPALWHYFEGRHHADFTLGDSQYFVMGDNSAESSDARLWLNRDPRTGDSRPGGAYLERSMLIGKALCVYWPHSWHRIPGTPIPFPLFPNFQDMRLVR
jgi:signal peptidase I